MSSYWHAWNWTDTNKDNQAVNRNIQSGAQQRY